MQVPSPAITASSAREIAATQPCYLSGCLRHRPNAATMRALRGVLDRQADERLEFGRVLTQPVPAAVRRVTNPAVTRPPRLSRWTARAPDKGEGSDRGWRYTPRY